MLLVCVINVRSESGADGSISLGFQKLLVQYPLCFPSVVIVPTGCSEFGSGLPIDWFDVQVSCFGGVVDPS